MTCRSDVAYGARVANSDNGRPPSGRLLVSVGPFALALFALVGTFGSAARQPDRRPLDALAVVLVLAGPLALLWLRRRPVPVLWFVILETLTYLVRGYPSGPAMISAVVAVFAAVVRGHGTAAWSVVAVLYVGHFALHRVFRDEPLSWGQALGVGAWALRRPCSARWTVVLSSHLMSEVQQICDRVGVIDRGRMLTRAPWQTCAAAASWS